MNYFAKTLLVLSLLSIFGGVAAYADSQPTKNWTFLVFVNGNNDLDQFGAMNINEMEQTGSTKDLNIVVQWASESRGTTQRLLVQKDSDLTKVTSPVLQDMGKVDMGDFHSLEDFIAWGVKNYPAQHYFITVWNHGFGWHNILGTGTTTYHPLDISLDSTTGHVITTEQLGQVMQYAVQLIGHKVDIYGSDACLMAMGEVASEMADSVDVFVGSQELEPGEGWPYGPFISKWAANPSMASEDVAKLLVHEYVASYKGGVHGTEDVTLSAYDMSQLATFNESLATLTSDLKAASRAHSKQLLDIMDKTMKFAEPDYGDVGDFLSKLSNARLAGVDSRHVDDVKIALKDFVIANEDTTKYYWATGVSFWMPPTASEFASREKRYDGLRFDEATKWGDLLKTLLGSTPRE